ncbi:MULTISPECIES: aspartate carbamoyltransferase [Cetobacterium]|jgi:aspartate carbamoyltransferase catalytic subunit|uniref:Aspartate carbamoyltransferase n=1 Tax=Candidatus Cetobacterium colombiensis TaxID=3073100 RepID=A0ABU4W8H5_9FUSO|nr:aspartate carbamoyltransferase [Candidatus Cetobacterium colombiensis]MDX8335804.1 aspartate carbamoyltransferase [Candidatus Cetobacterium colombiensis]
MRDFISMKDFTKGDILEVLRVAKELEKKNEELLRNKIVGSLFFEPSTRTRLSFTSAAYRLGAKVLGFDSPDATSLKKGESLRDTIKMTEAYSDVIVMRHNRDGAARFAADISKVPVVNAGDGANEHPSQTLLDLYTIQKEFGDIEGKKVAFVGDLKYGRTVHSLTKALEMFNCEFYFIAPDVIQIPEYITRELDKKGMKYHILNDYKDVLKEIDVLYMTRIQKERFDNQEDYEKVAGVYVIDKKNIVGKCKENMIILHPLPRVDEIKIDLDETKHAKYFEQAANGVPTREAIFSIALDLVKVYKDKEIIKNIKESEKVVCVNEKCITKFEETQNKYVIDKDHEYCYYCNRDIKK